MMIWLTDGWTRDRYAWLQSWATMDRWWGHNIRVYGRYELAFWSMADLGFVPAGHLYRREGSGPRGEILRCTPETTRTGFAFWWITVADLGTRAQSYCAGRPAGYAIHVRHAHYLIWGAR